MSYPPDLRYTRDHEWVRVSGELAEIGITHFAQEQLGEVAYVELPEVGKTIAAGARFGTIESVKAVSELFAPVSGEVLEVNDALKVHPEAVNASPHTTWLVRVRVAGSVPDSLLDSRQYETLLGS